MNIKAIIVKSLPIRRPKYAYLKSLLVADPSSTKLVEVDFWEEGAYHADNMAEGDIIYLKSAKVSEWNGEVRLVAQHYDPAISEINEDHIYNSGTYKEMLSTLFKLSMMKSGFMEFKITKLVSLETYIPCTNCGYKVLNDGDCEH